MPCMLRVTNLTFDYWDKPLFHDVAFSLTSGAALHVQGPNGVGKTTLLKLLAGLLHPLEGSISYQGTRAYVGHKNGVNTRLTPREHLRLDVGLQDETSINAALTRLALQEVQDTPVGLLSSGQKRRVGLLRLLDSNTKLWLLDEPLVGLDTAGMEILGTLLSEHLAQDGMLVFTSHQPLPFTLPNLQVLNL
jgi:heme exporter protein A